MTPGAGAKLDGACMHACSVYCLVNWCVGTYMKIHTYSTPQS